MYKKYGKTSAKLGSIDWRNHKTIHSFATSKDLKEKFNKFATKAKKPKSEILREALELFLDIKEDNTMAKAKAKKEFDWKGLVVTLHELDAQVSSAKLAEFIKAKGVEVSTRSIGAVRANLSR